MNKLHGKSPCCRGEVSRFGKRRRQCSLCGKTWRLWKKKQGRKPLRNNFDLLRKYLDNDIQPLARRARSQNFIPQTYSARVRNTLDAFLKRASWPAIPNGPLILIADALIQTIEKDIWTIYLFLVRPVKDKRAIILPPYIRLGPETKRGGWQSAFDSLTEEVKSRVFAFVSDGAGEALSQAKKRDWLIQRCQFHLLMRIANYVRPGPLSRRPDLALKIYPLVNTILHDADEKRVEEAVSRLDELIPSLRSKDLKTTVSGFVKNYLDYRTYLRFPEYSLPGTSNSIEAFNGQIRRLLFRAHGYRTVASFGKWLEALCKHKKTIACNGKINQPN